MDESTLVVDMAAEIVSAYVGNSSVPAEELPGLIQQVHRTLVGLTVDGAPTPAAPTLTPAVPVKKSITQDHIVCLEDGRKLKMLKRYLRARYDLSPEEYRRRWGLGPDYPMVAPLYAQRRSDFAKQIGLGRGVRRRKA